jgi:hypothetical protein
LKHFEPIFSRHQARVWYSGRIVASHASDPDSISGTRNVFEPIFGSKNVEKFLGVVNFLFQLILIFQHF